MLLSMQKNAINLFIQPLSYFDFSWITIELTRAISCWSVCILYPFDKKSSIRRSFEMENKMDSFQ